jgi:hypothetical protein
MTLIAAVDIFLEVLASEWRQLNIAAIGKLTPLPIYASAPALVGKLVALKCDMSLSCTA